MRQIILIIAIAATFVLGAVILKPWFWPSPVCQNGQESSQQSDKKLDPHWKAIQKWVNSKNPSGRSAVRMQVIRPGIILPAEANTYPPAPDDLHIVVTRKGNQPAMIEVHQGGKEWKISENDLNQLPAAIRTQVQRPLGWVLEGPAAEAAIAGLLSPRPRVQIQASPPVDPLQKKFDELNARVDELIKSIKDLQKEE